MKAVLEVNPDDENSDEYIQKIRSIGYSAKEEVSEEKKKQYYKVFHTSHISFVDPYNQSFNSK